MMLATIESVQLLDHAEELANMIVVPILLNTIGSVNIEWKQIRKHSRRSKRLPQ